VLRGLLQDGLNELKRITGSAAIVRPDVGTDPTLKLASRSTREG
jgi:hypothetical protein